MKRGNALRLLGGIALGFGLAVFLIGCQPPAETSQPPSPTPTETTAPTAESNSPPAPPLTDPVPTASPFPIPLAVPEEGVIMLPIPASALETERALWAAAHPDRDYYQLAVQLLGADPAALVASPPNLAALQIDDRADFFINADLNSDYRPIPARLRHLSENAAWWTSVSARAEDDEIAAAAAFFESDILPINRLIFGKEASPGIDNDRRIHILLVEEPQWGGYFGYFSMLNQYPTALQPFSNEREMFIINLGGVRMTSSTFGGELGHEYLHLIHWNLDANEDLWLNEAFGELAFFLSGAPPASSALGKTNAELFALLPEIQLTSRPEMRFGEEDRSVFAHYGAERLFLVYLFEQLGPEFIKSLANNPAPGIFSIQQELDKVEAPRRIQDIFADWLLANLLNQPNLEEGRWGYNEIAPFLPERKMVNSFRGEPVADFLPPYGARYYEIHADQAVEVSFNGSSLARLTPVDPAAGQFAWYSNRGDESVFRLTRAFDLRGLETATLQYDVWFQLEEFFDFAYLEVSTDGGATWTILETAHGTDRDPRGRSYGWGYTGSVLEWQAEEIDLSLYTGQEILLRFEVITDFTTNRDGLQLDNIAIPELGYFEGAEDEGGGWTAEGFVRSSNFVPVEWVVWLVELTQPATTVTRIPVIPGETTVIEIDGFGETFPFAALVVSPTAPVTTMEVDYELVFQNP